MDRSRGKGKASSRSGGASRGASRSDASSSRAVVPRGRQDMVVTGSSSGGARGRGGEVMLAPKGYTMRPIIPAEKKELVSVARAMHREKFGPRVQELFNPETEAAVEAIKSGVYIGWRCPEFKWDCIRVGRDSRCFCGHLLLEHAPYNGRSTRVPCTQGGCLCKAFAFVPGRPEDIGEFWHQKRRGFDRSAWRAKCRCKHTHEEHDPNGMRRCKAGGCRCSVFDSPFVCAACDRHYEDHETVFETEDERHRNGIPYGEDYLPFAEMPELRNMALTGHDDNPGIYSALVEGEGSIPRNQRAITQDTPYRPAPSGSSFKPSYD
ncbi:protein FAM221B-like [Saccoglossus kowalevskii]|uniref:Protein FAM221B-like n=1 Tax=Saccoglossus kowalevskii TaxID=10224 RepID=A0ABM0GLR3_SACKO|nr:PREDICTED: protein FAM221B-like [Saccoglossus kowalevskii]